MKLNKIIIFIVSILLLISSCKPQEITGKAVLNETTNQTSESDDQNKTAKKFTLPEKELDAAIEENNRKKCESQINDLEEKLDKDKFRLIKLNNNLTKENLKLSWLKDQVYTKDEDVEEQTKIIQQISSIIREAKSSIESAEDALKILKNSCGIEERRIF